MSRNALIILAIIVAVIVVGYLMIRGNSEKKDNETIQQSQLPPSVQQLQNDNKISSENTVSDVKNQIPPVVTYTDSGFSPNNLTIKNGQTVTFKNEGPGDMWVASAPHPTHTDYPEFDAKSL